MENPKRTAFYPGSFDPFHFGHLFVVQEAVELFDEVIIGIAYNPNKNRRFSPETMKTAIEQVINNLGLSNKVKVIFYSNLTFINAKNFNALTLVRGLRNSTDYEFEAGTAKANREIGGIRTIYFQSTPTTEHISSSIIMELYTNGVDISKYVPKPIIEAMNKKIS